MLRNEDDLVTNAETYKNLAIAKLFMGNAEEAFANMNLSVETAEKTNNRMLLARLYNTKAGIYQWSGNLDETIRTFQRVLEMRTELGDIDGQATTENSLGIAYTTKGEYSKAIECLEGSLELAQRVGNARLIADSYMNLGVVYRYMEEPDKAIECYQKCREAYKDMNIDFPRAIALCIGNLADAYKEKGDLEEAEKHHLEAIEMARQIGDRVVECYQYHGLSEIYLAREDYPSVLKNSERAMALAEELNDQETMGDVCKCICEVYRRMSRQEEALDYLKQANDHYAEIGAEAKLRELQKLKAKLTQGQSI
jgi:tetratricopeptide (TPR) repeat protein